jgi:MFS family permease
MASAKNKHVHTGGRILLGFAASPFEQLPAVTVADLFFVHHRGWGLSLYVFALSTGSLLGPTATGFVIETLGWRWVYWFYSIFMGAIVVIMFFGLEETGFDRPRYIPGAEDGNSSTQKRPYATKLRLASKFEVQKSFLGTITGPFRLMTEPIIAWSGIMYGFGIAWLSVMATTAFTTFQSPVYNFTFGQMGLTNLSPLIGSYISLYAGGAGADRFMLWKASRNGGVMEPESRIFSVFIAGPVMALGLFLYGIGASYSIHWIGPVIGMGFIGAALPITGEVALGYTSESYPVLTGEATTAVILIRNLIGCGMTFAINPWIERNGLRDTFIVAGILAFVVFMSGALFIWQGKNCRRRAAKMYRSMTTEVT